MKSECQTNRCACARPSFFFRANSTSTYFFEQAVEIHVHRITRVRIEKYVFAVAIAQSGRKQTLMALSQMPWATS